ncbi:hypothetical protein FRC07_009626 [Ceratobasidium sp. 392]|nr:hypothetical protein FRC07_009626 [Ceratobasidium sp. 392]
MYVLGDEFEFLDAEGKPTGKTQATQIGGATNAIIGARIWLPATAVGQVVDRGTDFPPWVQQELDNYGSNMWHFRDQATTQTTRSLNRYRGEHRDFEDLAPRIPVTPKDLVNTPLESPTQIHFVCPPTRASQIMHDAYTYGAPGWVPFTIYEPYPDSCIPEELPSLKKIFNRIDVLSPNAEEALGLLSVDKAGADTPSVIEDAAATFLSFGIGKDSSGYVIIRCGAMGAYGATLSTGKAEGWWVPAYWTAEDGDAVVDVTGAGNSFLGGLSAGLLLASGNVREAAMYATVSAGYTIQQSGPPRVEYKRDKSSGEITELWNGDLPRDRLANLRNRLK